MIDEENVTKLSNGFCARSNYSDARRLSELKDLSISHDWLWMLNPSHGPFVPPDELSMAVRIRIGAPLVDDAIECKRCGGVVDRTGKHCLRCALP